MLLTVPLATVGDEADGKPVATPQSINVEAGDAFDLELPVQAWTDANHTVRFLDRTRFTFPGSMSQTHTMVSGDAILFKVACRVDDDTPDGDFPVAFEISWDDNGTERKTYGEVKVVVGEGAGNGNICTSIMMVAAPAVLAFSVLIVQRRGSR
jgi:hypothetical protein